MARPFQCGAAAALLRLDHAPARPNWHAQVARGAADKDAPPTCAWSLNMNLSSLAVSPTTSAVQGSPAEEAQVLMLKKAQDIQASSASTLIQALPQPAALATSGSLGRYVNTFA
jgi:hypothetical protein